MRNDTEIWLERLASLYKSQQRQAAATLGVPVVHGEILQYLYLCNDYSNTAQAMSEYLGQTKGSISQSIKVMEKMDYIKRQPSLEDKRVFKLYLTEKGRHLIDALNQKIPPIPESQKQMDMIKILLQNWQSGHQKQGFGQCMTCRYHKKISNDTYQCGLTGLPLQPVEIRKICREHRF